MKRLIISIAFVIVAIELGCLAFDTAQESITADMQQKITQMREHRQGAGQ